MRKAIFIALATMFLATLAWAQSNTAPKFLVISRESIKEGRMSQYQGLDKQVRQVVHKNDPNLNWITATAFTGTDNEETYFQFANSYADIEQADAAFGKAAGSLFMSADFSQTVAESQESGRNIIAKLRDDLSFNADKFDPGNARFWYVSYRRIKPGSGQQFASLRKDITAQLKTANYDDHWLTYEVEFGMPTPTFVVVRELKSLAELDTDLSKPYEAAVATNLRQQQTSWVHENGVSYESVIYRIKPELSHPAQSLVAANPGFWTVQEPESAPVVAKKKNKKLEVQPAALKEKTNK
jgi:hypothetical protein